MTVYLNRGMKVPNLPQEYLDEKGHRHPELSLLMLAEGCPRGVIIIIKDEVIVDILHVGSFDLPEMAFDGIIMHPQDVSDEAVQASVKSAQKYYS